MSQPTTAAAKAAAPTPVAAATHPLREAIIKLSTANTLAWARREGLEPQQVGADSARDQRVAQLTADLGRQISRGAVQFKQLIEELYGRPLPSLEVNVTEWGSLIAVVTEAEGGGGASQKGTVSIRGKHRGIWKGVSVKGDQDHGGPTSAKAHIRPATPEEIKKTVGLLADGAILELSVDLTLTA